MCSAACSGTATPHMRPTSLAHIPAQLTTYSHSTSPLGVETPETAPSLRWMAVTLVSSKMDAPALSAAAAIAIATSPGTAWPSFGIYMAPIMSSVTISGSLSPASRGLSRVFYTEHAP